MFHYWNMVRNGLITPRLALAALVAQSGAIPKLFPLVPDTLDATRAAMANAFAGCDLVVTSGGVSVGAILGDFVFPGAFLTIASASQILSNPDQARKFLLFFSFPSRTFCCELIFHVYYRAVATIWYFPI